MVKKIFVQQYGRKVTHLSQQGYGKKKVQHKKSYLTKEYQKELALVVVEKDE